MSDFVVIGAGVNGLACALELARTGKKVTVVEARNIVGGMSARRKFGDFEVPGLRHDTVEIRPELVASLGLAEHGLTLLGEHVPVFSSDEKDGLILSFDAAAAREEIARRSAKDVERYTAFRTLLGLLKPVVTPLLNKAPPPLLPRGMGEMADMGLLGMKLRGLGGRNMTEIMRAAPMCVADWMREQFDTEILSATLALPAVQGDFVGPWSPGTAAFLILRETMAV